MKRLAAQMLLGISLVLVACGSPAGETATVDSDATVTAVIQTFEAQLTLEAPLATPTPVLQVETATSTTIPTAETQLAGTPTSTQSCDLGQFIADVTVPDGTKFSSNQSFTKTWKLKNTGNCTWSTGYKLVFYSGDSMGGPATQALATSVAPGQEIDISVALKAPATLGTYRGYWRLQNAAGVQFPIANGYGGMSFFVEIEVADLFAISSVTFSVTCPTPDGWLVQATITVNAPGTVSYRWIINGVQPALQPSTLVFNAAGSQTISQTIESTLANFVTDLWAEIDVAEPVDQTYGRAILSCP